ncbi:MAG: FKBP-type peptidyl-prolyl cis-trans isomerase [Desulfomonilaceae bacterium]|nr:FKBP-type peptidyl-prolyl cis-trans isomerase [Desulfomonilaceae bacterium]
MTQARQGDTVKIHFTGTLPDGEVFDSSFERDPAQFTIGQGTVVPGIEEAVIGMEEGERKITVIPPEKGFGNPRSELLVEVERERFPEGLNPQVGQHLRFLKNDGQEIMASVVNVSESSVVVDANHPLSGREITLDILLVEIV